jgi:hypothetical protein
MTAGENAAMRASDVDRHRVQSRLNDAFAEGRLSQPEWDERATALASAVTHGDLAQLTADLPVPYAPPPAVAQQHTNGLAIAALVCGIGQLLVGFPAGIAAIILGHKARRTIRRTGEQGDGMAQVGLIIGYVGVIGLALILALAAVAFTSVTVYR